MRVLVADDDRDFAAALTDCVEACGHQVVDTVSGGGLAVIQSFNRHEPDAVLLDVQMPRCNGLTVCHALLSRRPGTRVIFISGRVEGDHPFISGCGAAGYLPKPVGLSELRDALAGVAP
jgi:DNA-binding response OmpR family regulator